MEVQAMNISWIFRPHCDIGYQLRLQPLRFDPVDCKTNFYELYEIKVCTCPQSRVASEKEAAGAYCWTTVSSRTAV